jgi:hypothetical protein
VSELKVERTSRDYNECLGRVVTSHVACNEISIIILWKMFVIVIVFPFALFCRFSREVHGFAPMLSLVDFVHVGN